MGGDWGIYRGDCILIPAFPPVTPFQVNRKKSQSSRRGEEAFFIKREII